MGEQRGITVVLSRTPTRASLLLRLLSPQCHVPPIRAGKGTRERRESSLRPSGKPRTGSIRTRISDSKRVHFWPALFPAFPDLRKEICESSLPERISGIEWCVIYFSISRVLHQKERFF